MTYYMILGDDDNVDDTALLYLYSLKKKKKRYSILDKPSSTDKGIY